jgi:hypothetical protein
VISGGTFDGVTWTPKACKTDADCDAGNACGSESTCLPVIPPCTSRRQDCTEHHVIPTLDPNTVAELDPVQTLRTGTPTSELVYVQYYASHGDVSPDSKTVVGAHGPVTDPPYDTVWLAPSTALGETRIWAIVKDDRGGVTWWWQDLVVR